MQTLSDDPQFSQTTRTVIVDPKSRLTIVIDPKEFHSDMNSSD